MNTAAWTRFFTIACLSIASVNAQPCVSAEIGIISPMVAHHLLKTAADKDRPIVLDTRGGYKDYFRGHLPYAHHLNFDTLRGTDLGIPVQYLPDDLTKSLLVRGGVQKNRTHILYATGDKLPNDEILSTSMVAYVLEKFGVEDIRIVDGGLASWVAATLPTTQEYYGNPTGELPTKSNAGIGIDLTELMQRKDLPGVLLVDARPRNEYLGDDDVWLRKGHIPGAISYHWARLMDSSNTHQFRSLESNLAELKQAGITSDKEIIVYCGTSREGSLLRFYLRHVAKYPNVRLYEGSWKEYAFKKQYPAERQENKVR
jgi:thiosulfate/3-mercaptopyruvate sulfurtransferase